MPPKPNDVVTRMSIGKGLAFSIATGQLGVSLGNGLGFDSTNKIVSLIGKFIDGTDPLNAVYVGGNVGIGTLAPEQRLDISSGANYKTLMGGNNLTFHNKTTSPSYIDQKGTGGINFRMGATLVTKMTLSKAGDLNVARDVSAERLTRIKHEHGNMEGGYNNIGASGAYSSPIYTIGSRYNPAAKTLANMYGIGYCKSSDASFISEVNLGVKPRTGWGMYVAATGRAKIFLCGTTGDGYFKGNMHTAEPTKPTHLATKNYVDTRKNKGRIVGGGRWYLLSTRTWTAFDNTYGRNYVQQRAGKGTGTKPTLSYQNRGTPFLEGDVLNSYVLRGRANSQNIKGIEFYLVFESSDFDNVDVDTSAEVNVNVLYAGTMTPSTGDMKGISLYKIDLGDFVCPQDGQLTLYLRRSVDSIGTSNYYLIYDDIICYEF